MLYTGMTVASVTGLYKICSVKCLYYLHVSEITPLPFPTSGFPFQKLENRAAEKGRNYNTVCPVPETFGDFFFKCSQILK